MKTVTFLGTGEEVAVGKILCLGRNYAGHVKEMKAEVPEQPVVFLKPSSALLGNGGMIKIPPLSNDLHHEVEMVVVIGKQGTGIAKEHALSHVAGYAVGLDMTLRDLQAEAKAKGLPWTIAKGFDTSAPVSPVMHRSSIPDPHKLGISLTVNGSIRQKANTSSMIFSVPTIISFLSSLFTLEPGDLIFTGTPEGVGRVVSGDTLEATLDGVGSIKVGVA